MKKREHTPVTITCIGSSSAHASRQGDLLGAVLNGAAVLVPPFRTGPLVETLRGAA